MKKIVFSFLFCLALIFVPAVFLSACSTVVDETKRQDQSTDDEDGGDIDDDPVYYTVSFDSDGGTPVESQTVLNGRSIQAPDVPTKAGYVFDGWYINSRYTMLYNFNTKVRGGGFTLYAHWYDANLIMEKADKGNNYYVASCSSNAVSVEVPSVFNGQNVVGIRDGAFSSCKKLTSVSIPQSITTIGEYAFYDCTALEEIVLPEGLTMISAHAFDGCTNLTSIVMPSTVKYIMSYAFASCSGLSSIDMPSSLVSLGDGVFADCTALEELFIPAKVLTIGSGLVDGCTSLESISVSESNQTFNSNDNCNAIVATKTNTFVAACKNTSIPLSMTRISSFAFDSCSNLTSITIPGTVTKIGAYAFNNITGLTEVIFANDSVIESIPNGLFEGCVNLETIVIPASIKEIGANAFYGCTSLSTISFEAGSGLEKIGANMFAGTAVSTFTVPASVKEIGANAFNNCSNLETLIFEAGSELEKIGANAFNGTAITSLTIPASVTTISANAFRSSTIKTIIFEDNSELLAVTSGTFANSSVLETVNFGDSSSLKTIGDDAFKDLSSLKAVNFGASSVLESIGRNAFTNTSITTISIPAGVTVINSNAFGGCSRLATISFAENSELETIGVGVFAGTAITSITIPASVETIYSNAFSSTSLKTIVFEADSVLTSVIDGTFAGCSALESITFGNGLVTIGEGALKDIATLKTVTFGASSHLTTIGKNAFANTSITNLTIPATVTNISANAFSGCASLANISFAEGSALETIGANIFAGAAITSITIPASVTTIGANAFDGCSGLSEILFEEGSQLETIGANAFYGTSITSITIPSSVTSLGVNSLRLATLKTVVFEADSELAVLNEGVFAGCSVLESVTFGNGLQTIGANALRDLPRLKTIVFGASPVIETIGANAFSGTAIAEITIPATVEEIGASAFEDCARLANVSFAAGSALETIGARAFAETAITAISIPGSVNTIGASALSSSRLKTVVFAADSELATINEGTFAGCTNLESITFGAGLETIGDNSFKNLTKLKTVDLGESTSVETIGRNAFAGATALTSISIPASVVSLGASAFDGCSRLATIEFEDNSSLISIGARVFAGTAITLISLPTGVSQISDYAFASCSNLESFEIPSGVVTIGANAFDSCANITEISIPASVVSLGANAFDGCSNLSVVKLESNNNSTIQRLLMSSAFNNYTKAVQVLNSNFVSAYYFAKNLNLSLTVEALWTDAEIEASFELEPSPDRIGYNITHYTGNASVLSLPSSYNGIAISGIGSSAFSNKHLVSVVLPEGLAYIGRYAFWMLEATTVSIPSTVQVIEEYAFAASSLSSVVFAEGSQLQAIGEYAFASAEAIEEGNIVPRLTSINIEDCSNLLTISQGAFAGQPLGTITFPSSLRAIGEEAFGRCSNLLSVYIPASVTSISSGAFYGCSGITSIIVDPQNSKYDSRDNCNAIILSSTNTLVYACASTTIPASIKAIGDAAFQGIRDITEIILPYGIEKIGYAAFDECRELESIYIPSSVTSIASSAFGHTNISSLILPDSITTLVPDDDGDFSFSVDEIYIFSENAEKLSALTRLFDENNVNGNIYVWDYMYDAAFPDGGYSFSCNSIDASDIFEFDNEGYYYAVTGLRGDNYYGGKGDGGSSSSNFDTSSMHEIFIPSFYNNKPVKAIWGSRVFATNEANFTRIVHISKNINDINGDTLRNYEGYLPLTIVIDEENESLELLDNGSICSLDDNGNIFGLLYVPVGVHDIPAGTKYLGQDLFYDDDTLTSITIPASVEYIRGSFSYCSNLSSVIIEQGSQLQLIGDYAFAGTAITSISIPSSLQDLSDGAFRNSNLTSIDLSACTLLTEIGDEVFESCEALATVVLPQNLTTIGEYAFHNSGLTSIQLPATVTSIGRSAFSGTRITSVTIPASVTSIEYEAFGESNYLQSVTIKTFNSSLARQIIDGIYVYYGQTVTLNVWETMTSNISSYVSGNSRFIVNSMSVAEIFTLEYTDSTHTAYRLTQYLGTDDALVVPSDINGTPITEIGNGQSKITSTNITMVVIPSSVTKINTGAFINISSLAFVSFESGSNLAYIGQNAFSGTAIADISLPASVSSIGIGAFAYCNSLEKLTLFSDNTETLVSLCENLVSSLGAGQIVEVYYVAYEACLEAAENAGATYTLAELDSIVPFQDVFYYETNSNGIVIIGLKDSSYRDLVIPSRFNGRNVVEIGYEAFKNESITSVVIPETVVSISGEAFRGCSSLVSVTFKTGSALKTIGNRAFAYCNNLRTINLEDCTSLETIDNRAFSECERLTSITIPASVVALSSGDSDESDFGRVFYGCYSLSSVTFASGSALTVLPASTFSECLRLVSINLEACTNLTQIGANAFKSCAEEASSNNFTLIIPASVSTLGENVFYSCCFKAIRFASGSNLTYIGTTFESCGFKEIYLPEGITTISGYAFRESGDLTNISIPASVTSIGDYAFYDCYDLKTVEFAENSRLRTIGYEAFYSCGDLRSIALPSGLQEIGSNAFYGCSNLQEITIPGTVTTIGNYVFENCYELEKIVLCHTSWSSSLSDFFDYIAYNFYHNNTLHVEVYDEIYDTALDNYHSDYNYYYVIDLSKDISRLFTFELNGTETAYTITAYTGRGGDVVIPSEYNGLPVTAIGSNIFEMNGSSVTTLEIPSSIETIAEGAFSTLSNLQTIYLTSENSTAIVSALTIIYSYDYSGTIYVWDSMYSTATSTKNSLGASFVIEKYDDGMFSFDFDSSTNTWTITGYDQYYNDNAKNVVIPSTHNGMPVTKIGSMAFRDKAITSLRFSPNSNITEIASDAFNCCQNLTLVELPSSLVTIGNNAFAGCSKIESITIPASVTSIGEGAFCYCHKLTELNFAANSSLQTIGNNAFASCPINSLVLPASVETIGEGAFSQSGTQSRGDSSSYALFSITFAQDGNLTSIGYRAFYRAQITELHIPASVTSIADEAFSRCDYLSAISVDASNTVYYSQDQHGQYNAVIEKGTNKFVVTCINTTLPEGVTEISNRMFYGATFESFTIPSTVTRIGEYAFANSGLESIIIPASVQIIARYAFSGCHSLEEITFESGSQLQTIGDHAFDDCCNNLESIDLSPCTLLTEIPEYAFEDCSDLNSVYLPSSITRIGNYAFQYCYDLYSFTLPQNLEYIAPFAFEDTNISYIDCDNCNNFSFENYCLVQTQTNTLSMVLRDEDWSLPYGISAIGDYVFYNYYFDSRSFTIPASVTTIGSYAFAECGSLESVIFGKGSQLETIGDHAFYLCYNLRSISIPASVTSIGDHAFYAYEYDDISNHISSLTIAENSQLRTIGQYAFYHCGFSSITIPASVTSIGSSAFHYCYNLQNLSFASGSQLETIGEYAFCSTNIDGSLELPSSLKALGSNAFASNSNLTSVTIPASLSSVGDYVFSGCSSLANATILTNASMLENIICSPCYLGEYINNNSGTIYVWSSFVTVAQNFCNNYGYYNITVSGIDATDVVSLEPNDSSNPTYYIVTGIIDSSATSLVFPGEFDGLPITTIADSAFSGNTNLVSVVLPEGLTTIGESAFQNCSNLSSVSLPSTLVLVGASAFNDCGNLEDIIVPAGLTDIQNLVYDNGISNITLHATDLDVIKSLCDQINQYALNIQTVAVIVDKFEAVSTYCEAEGYSFTLEIIWSLEPLNQTWNFEYNSETDSYTVSNYHGDSVATLYIPGEYNGKPVTKIGELYGNSTTTRIVLPEGIVVIGGYAFRGMTSLTNINIPSTVTTIEYDAFGHCDSLSSITFPASLKEIFFNPFTYCNSLTNVVFENTEPIRFTGYDETEGYYEYYISYRFENGYIIVTGSFDYEQQDIYVCRLLAATAGATTIPSGVTDIGDSSFHGINVTSVTIPATVDYFAEDIFYDCELLQSVTFEAGGQLDVICLNDFYNCLSLREIINIPATVSIIENDTFRGCTMLETITVEAGSAFFRVENGCLIDIANSKVILGTKNTTAIPAGITTIGSYAFNGMGITSMSIPSSVTTIKEYAFNYCTSLQSVVIAEGVQTIGAFAFQNCHSLIQINIPASVRSIGTYGISSLNDNCEITIDSRNAAFVVGTLLPSFRYNGSYTLRIHNEVYSSAMQYKEQYQYDGAYFTLELIFDPSEAFDWSIDDENHIATITGYNYSATDITIPAEYQGNTVAIGANAFEVRDFDIERYITIPVGVTSIDAGAFYNNGACATYIKLLTENIADIQTIISAINNTGSGSHNTVYVWDCMYNTAVAAKSGDYTISRIDDGMFSFEEISEYDSELGYDVPTGNVRITGYDTTYNNGGNTNPKLLDVFIPSTYYNSDSGISMPITEIGSGTFSSKDLKTVTFSTQSQVETIAESAFQSNDNLTSVVLPSSLTLLNTYAFQNCYNLSTINLNACTNLATIGEFVFDDCHSLTSLSIPASVSTIGHGLTSGCSSLTTLLVDPSNTTYYSEGNCIIRTSDKVLVAGCATSVIPSDVTAINECSFYDCKSITSVTIPAAVTTIGNQAFYNCTLLAEVVFEEGSTCEYIGSEAFYGCTSLQEITIPASVETISVNAFNSSNSNSSLSSITFESGSGLKTIGDSAFAYSKVTSICIPASVTNIGNNIFGYCTSLVSVSMENNGNETYSSPAGSNYIATNENVYVVTASILTIPTGTTAIPDNAFTYNTTLTRIVIPASVESIGNYAFNDCSKLAEVVFAEGTHLETIGASAFHGCSSLREITIPAAVTNIGDSAFGGCMSLRSVIFEGNSQCTTIGNSAFVSCYELQTITIPASVTSIGNSAFAGSSSLRSVTFEENSQCTTIGSSTFYGCSNLQTLEIPASVSSIGSNFLDGANSSALILSSNNPYYTISNNCLVEVATSKLHTILNPGDYTIPSGIQVIGAYAFMSFNNFESFTIPASVTEIESYAFAYNDSLQTVTFESGSTLTIIGAYAFTCCYSLSSITIPSSVTTIGTGAFDCCYNLSSITIPASVTSIGENAFYSSSLQHATIVVTSADVYNATFDGEHDDMARVIQSYYTSYSNTEYYILASVVDSNPDNAYLVDCGFTNKSLVTEGDYTGYYHFTYSSGS